MALEARLTIKLTVFTTATAPRRRGDLYGPSITCFAELADELIIIAGDENTFENIYKRYGGLANVYEENHLEGQLIPYKWPQEFSWEFIGQQFQRGYEACTGDWVIHMDLDFIFHEKDFDAIRQAIERNKDAPALSFYKYQFILPDRYNLKSRLVLAVNKGKFGDRIKFNGGGDLCQPTIDGKDLKQEDIPESGIAFYNYEKLIKTEAQVRDDVGRMARAWQRYFGEYKLGNDDNAYDVWLEMMVGRFHKPSRRIKLDEHPKYIQETIRSITPEMWGYSGFGNLERNSYV